jgi:hypothetical protein
MLQVCEMFQSFMNRANKNDMLLSNAKQAQYLADFSWNIGLDAYSTSTSEVAFKFMFVSAFVISKLVNISDGLDEEDCSEYRYRQAVALTLAIASLTTAETSAESDDKNLSQKSKEDIRKQRHIANMTRLKGAMAQLRGMLANKTDARFVDLKLIAHALEYDIACSSGDVTRQIKIVEELTSSIPHDSRALSTLITIANRGACLRTSDLITVCRAYEVVASTLAAQSPIDVELTARVMRRRIQLASRIYKSNDQSIHDLYDLAEQIVTVTPKYPPIEAQWLLATCFNRAVRHERSLRTAKAIEWLKRTQHLLAALEHVLPHAIDRYSGIIDENLLVLSLENDNGL